MFGNMNTLLIKLFKHSLFFYIDTTSICILCCVRTRLFMSAHLAWCMKHFAAGAAAE